MSDPGPKTPRADSGYFSKLRNFADLFDERTAVAVTILGEDSEPGRAILRYRDILAGALAELGRLYTAKFIDDSLPAEQEAILPPLEANIAMATQQNLEIMRRMISIRSGNLVKPLAEFRLRRLTAWMEKTSSSLQRRGDIPLSLRISVPQLLLAGRKPLRAIGSVVYSTVTRKSVTAMAVALDPSNFLRTDAIGFDGVDAAVAQLNSYPRRVLVMIANHDLGIFDGAITYELALRLGSQRHISMTRKLVYPIPPPESAGDVVYVNEADPKYRPVSDCVRKIREALQTASRVSLAIYPEGMMPFTGAQMPMITKEGAHVIARKLAIELQDLDAPVILLETNLNVLRHLTQTEIIAPRVTIANIEVVPTAPLGRNGPDEWVSRSRVESERRFNADRGERMMDILRAKPLPDSMTFPAETLGALSTRAAGTRAPVPPA